MLEDLLEILRRDQGLLAYLLVLLAALSEYIVPPFPGDTITLFAVFLAAQAELHPVGVYVAMTIGAMIGGLIAWGVGVWLADREERWPSLLRRPGVQDSLAAVRRGYEKHGAAYLLINRFLPAFRAFFFIGAGLSRMRAVPVLVYGGISAALWNAILLGIGYSVGRNWETLRSLFQQYVSVTFVAVLVVLAVFWFRSRKA